MQRGLGVFHPIAAMGHPRWRLLHPAIEQLVSHCVSVLWTSHEECDLISIKKMGGLSSVSMSITSAIIYVIFGGIFFLLIFLLVMIGVTDCNWNCNRYKA